MDNIPVYLHFKLLCQVGVQMHTGVESDVSLMHKVFSIRSHVTSELPSPALFVSAASRLMNDSHLFLSSLAVG